MKPIGVLGDGAWGTAVANVLARNGYQVKLWCYQETVAQSIKKSGINERYLPGVVLDNNIEPVTDIAQAVCGVSWIFEAIPVQYLREIISPLASCVDRSATWVVLSKGIEQKTLLLPSQIIDDALEFTPSKVVFAGPNFAAELARGELSATVVAAHDYAQAQELQKLLANDYFRPYVCTDMIGAQVGGALKNVIALVVGMLDGAGFNHNAKAFVLTRGLHEMAIITTQLGGSVHTVYGLSGVGDLVLTAMGGLSKNMQVGQRLGKGQKLDDILQQTGFVPEGINTLQSVNQLLKMHKLDMPICARAYEVVFGALSVDEMMKEVMALPLGKECD